MTTSPHVIEVGALDFGERVLAKSRELPVLVDFWAAWCQPCQMLAPILAKVAEAYVGRIVLAKVDTERHRELALGYGIRGLPTVKLFRDGEVVDEFVGLQSEAVIRQIIERHLPRPSDALVQRALALHGAGDSAQALQLLEEALAAEPASDAVKLALAGVLLARSRLDEAQHRLAELSASARATSQARALAADLQFARLASDAPSLDDLQKTVATNPGDCRARQQLAARAVLVHKYELALQQLLEIVRRDRRFGEDAGRKEMLAVFELLGGKGELVNKYRNLLSAALN
jgi:putative thioredoxin